MVGVLFPFAIEVGVPPGPVGLADLDFLVALGARVVIVSKSANCANLPFEHIVAVSDSMITFDTLYASTGAGSTPLEFINNKIHKPTWV